VPPVAAEPFMISTLKLAPAFPTLRALTTIVVVMIGAVTVRLLLTLRIQPLLVTVYVIVAVPADTPETTPEPFTIATLVLLLLHVPPESPLEVSVAVVPVDRVLVPEIVPALGNAFIVTVVEVLVLQPFALTAYVTVAVPAATPDTTPEALTVATAVLLLDQVPPANPLVVRGVVAPAQIVVVPEIVPALGNVFIVTVVEVLVLQPFALTEYVTVAVPAATPETTPEALTVATAVLLLDQVPPANPLVVRDVVAPAQKLVVPEIVPALGRGVVLTFSILPVALQLPTASLARTVIAEFVPHESPVILKEVVAVVPRLMPFLNTS
jgi:hypothetical protein